ncbi:hypothetical protein K493DRAFT_18924 [Basidiobolus meristosporus CBS 931.73]|uniref:Secreted protein n=1 Tax=Basidiobolus meristosporus CBS 931.73 TaxID=1314790 RepID=A0A1Y1YF95_9FUNG|nr:hypothetical protein K493DRAFT_18924 [Basidiobolus meristosporus CBS 931.73]|eukprot:ORX96628.1 hypothetical protein K493DRAFT_18924 [Basidiobolus meristosporus CBS 931.73]
MSHNMYFNITILSLLQSLLACLISSVLIISPSCFPDPAHCSCKPSDHGHMLLAWTMVFDVNARFHIRILSCVTRSMQNKCCCIFQISPAAQPPCT